MFSVAARLSTDRRDASWKGRLMKGTAWLQGTLEPRPCLKGFALENQRKEPSNVFKLYLLQLLFFLETFTSLTVHHIVQYSGDNFFRYVSTDNNTVVFFNGNI